jgi:hypothetical protein
LGGKSQCRRAEFSRAGQAVCFVPIHVETVTATATKRVITHQIAMEMKRRRLPVELR